MYFYDASHTQYMSWEDIMMIPPTPSQPSEDKTNPPLTAVDIATTAVATAIPKPPDATEIAVAFQSMELCTSQQTGKNSFGSASPNSSNTNTNGLYNTSASIFQFNPNALQPDSK